MANCCTDLISLFPGKESCLDANKTSAEENGMRFYLLKAKGSTKAVCKIQIDNCLIVDQTQNKCDFLFKVCPDNDLYFVELKGKDVEKAYLQILETIRTLKTTLKPTKNNIYGVIVPSATPAFNSTSMRLQEAFKRDIGNRLIIKNKVCTINL